MVDTPKSDEPKKKKEPDIAPSAYIRAINHLASGDEESARLELERIKTEWAKYNIIIDVDETVRKMRSDISRNIELASIQPGFPEPKNTRTFRDIPYLDYDYPSTRQKKTAPSATKNEEVSKTQQSKREPDLSFNFDKKEQLPQGAIPIDNIDPETIYRGAISLPVDKLRAGEITIKYNNVEHGGYAPNLIIQFNHELDWIHNAGSRLKTLSAYLKRNNIQIENIHKLTALELAAEIGRQINNMSLHDDQAKNQQYKEEMLEVILNHVTSKLLNETDVTNDYIIATDSKISGRHYGHVGLTGGLINSLFSNLKSLTGNITTGMHLKAGTADCRATNATYAALLNIGYAEIGSEKEAKILYTKFAHGTSKETFEKCLPEDHNIVLVKQASGKIRVMDAYFGHANDTLLSDAIRGHAKRGALDPDENKIGDARTWAFQIPGVPPYPPQQNIQPPLKRTDPMTHGFKSISDNLSSASSSANVSPANTPTRRTPYSPASSTANASPSNSPDIARPDTPRPDTPRPDTPKKGKPDRKHSGRKT